MSDLPRRLSRAIDQWADASELRQGREGSARIFTREMKGRLEGGKAGTSYRAVLTYLNGESEPSLEWLRQAADLLGVRFAWLVAGEGEPTDELEEASRWLQDAQGRKAARAGLRSALPLDAWDFDAEPALLYAWLRLSLLAMSESGSRPTNEEFRELAETVGECVLAPLGVIGWGAEELQGLAGDMYVTALSQALVALSLVGMDAVEVQTTVATVEAPPEPEP